MDPRPLTEREQAVLAALPVADFPGAEPLRRQAEDVVVTGVCGCGCPSIDFRAEAGLGMWIRINAGVRGSRDGLFLYTAEDSQGQEILGGIDWVGGEETDPAEFPPPGLLDIRPPGR